MTATVAAITNALQTIWPQKRLDQLMFETSPAIGVLPKKDGFVQDDKLIVFKHAPTAGASADFTQAQANVGASAYARVRISRVSDYSLFRITTEALRAAKAKGPHSLLSILEEESGSATYAFMQSLAVGVYGNGGGSLGQIASGGGTTTITLTDPEDCVNFEVGMVVDTSSDDGTGGAGVDGNLHAITAIDYEAGTLTAAANWDGGAGHATANDHLFRDGDYNGKMLGLSAWLPLTVGGADSFGDDGLNRSTNRVRLAGVPYTADAADDGTIERTLIKAAAKLYRLGGRARPDCVVMNPVPWAQLVNEMGAKVHYDKMSAVGSSGQEADFGFKTLKLATARGLVDVMPDPFCPIERAYMLTKSTWEIQHLGGLPSWLDDDGNRGLRRGDADTIEWRLGAYFNMHCTAPGQNAVIDLTEVLES